MLRWQKAPIDRAQLVLFAESLDSRIPRNHTVRLLDEILELHDWSSWEREYDGHQGQPAIHPKVLSCVILYGLLRRIRSSRELEYAVSTSIDFIWLVSGRSIDHTTISKFRKGHGKQLRELYRGVCRQAIGMGLAKLAEVCIDGSRILGNASRHHTITAAKAEKMLDALDQQINSALEAMERKDAEARLSGDVNGHELPVEISDPQKRREKLLALQKELREMDALRQKEGIDPAKNPAQLSPTDPDARILPNKAGGYAPNYTPMAITDTEHGIIVGADVLVGNVEHIEAVAMIDELRADYGQHPTTVLADTAYSTGPNIADLEERSIEFLSPLATVDVPRNPAIRENPRQPVAEDQLDQLPINKQTKRFDKQAFVYDEGRDVYYCPAGQELTFTYSEKVKIHGRSTPRRAYECKACEGCPLASRCRTNPQSTSGRRVNHDVFEAHRQRHREKMRDPSIVEKYNRRLHFGETQFGFIKQWVNLRQFLLRGIDNVRQEWLWSCTAYNLKKLLGLWDEICAFRNEQHAKAVA